MAKRKRILTVVTGGFSFGRSCPTCAGFVLTTGGRRAGDGFTGFGLTGSEMTFFPGGSSLDSEVERLIPDMPPTGRKDEGT